MRIIHDAPIKEFADDRRRDLGLIGHRLKLFRHSRCACGERATVLVGGDFFCAICGGWESCKRRARNLGV